MPDGGAWSGWLWGLKTAPNSAAGSDFAPVFVALAGGAALAIAFTLLWNTLGPLPNTHGGSLTRARALREANTRPLHPGSPPKSPKRGQRIMSDRSYEDGGAGAPRQSSLPGEGDDGAAAASVDSEDGPTAADLAVWLDAARARLDAGDADGALGFALAAVKFSAGGNHIAISRALDAAKAKAAADRERVRRQHPGLSEEDVSMVAAADAVRDDMLARPSLLADRGRSSLLREAMEGGSSVVCIRCGGLVPRERTEAHRTLWCPKLADDEVDTAAALGEDG